MNRKRRTGFAALLIFGVLLTSLPVCAVDSQANTSERAVNEGLIAKFTFDDEATGFSGAGAKAERAGEMALTSDAISGKALKLEGNSSSWLNVTNQNGGSLLSGLTSATFAYYSKATAAANGWSIFAAPNNERQNSGQEHYIGVIDKSSGITIERYNNSGSRPNNNVTGSSGDKWKFVVIVVEPGKTTLYVDGAATSSNSTYTMEAILGSSSIFQIGKANWTAGGEYFNGWIDEFAVYNRALSIEEIQELQSQSPIRTIESIAIKTGPDKTVYDMREPLDLTGLTIEAAYGNGTKEIFGDTSEFSVSGFDNMQNGVQRLTLTFAGKTVSFEVTVNYADEAAVINWVKESLTIANAENIRESINLPAEMYGACITWKSSHPDVITSEEIVNEDYDNMPAGFVRRQDKDTEVTLKATIQLGQSTGTKEIKVMVKKRPEPEELESYIFPFFPSDSSEQLYLAAGKDAFHFTDLNNGQPVLTSNIGDKGVRDPYIFRSAEGDKFYIIATDLKVQTTGWDKAQFDGSLSMLVWESYDLINWSEARLVDVGMTEYEDVGCVWAPEAIYDELTGEYVVFWASMTGKRDNSYQIVYYSKTRDFIHFTKAEKYIDRGDWHCIDTSMIKAGDKYFRVSSDAIMRIEMSDTVLGEWKVISTITDLHKSMQGYAAFYAESGLNLTGGVIEGPEFFKFNGEEKWGLYVDNYVNAGYIPITTTDISDTTGSKWNLYTRSQYDFGALKKRHGSVLGITRDEYVNVMEKWGNMQTVSVTYTAAAGGSIQGMATQKLEKGTDTKEVVAIAEEGYLFSGWSDGVVTAARKDIDVQENLQVSAIFKQDADAKAVMDLIKAIGTVQYTSASRALIDAAKAGYNTLSVNQKALIPNSYAILLAAEQTYQKLEEEAKANTVKENKRKAQVVIDQINAIGHVTKSSKGKIEAAEKAYAALTNDQKKLVTNYTVLSEARKNYNKLIKQETIPAVGKKYKVGKFQYKVLKSAKKNGTVELVKVNKNTYRSLTIQTSVSINGYKFKIVSIGKNAFLKNKKLTKITIGKNVTKIGRNAFSGCEKLKNITIKASKISSIGKNAFKGIRKKVSVKVPPKRLKYYRELLSKKGISKNAVKR